MPKQQLKSPYLTNNYFTERQDNKTYTPPQNTEVGTLGGEVSSELGFGSLEAAKEYVESFKPWNSEEWELIQEQVLEQIKQKQNTSSS